MYFTEKEIKEMFKEAGIEFVDKKAEQTLYPKVIAYLKEKWENKNNKFQYETENERLKKIGDILLKDF